MKKFLIALAMLVPFAAHATGESTSPNMSLTIPGVGVTPGPEWAQDLVTSLNVIDAHDHTPGNGVQITPSGLDINSDLTMQGNNLTVARSIRFDAQSSTFSAGADVGAVYESGVDLYYRDGNGNNIRLTQSGSIVGTSGSISGLVSPASASYVPGTSTFVWQSAVNTSANLDAACLIQRNATASSNGITLCAPAALAANYALTWPGALPASQKFMTMDSSGNIAAPWAVDNSTIEVSSNTVRVKDQGITQAKLEVRTTGTTVSAGGIALSASSGNFSNSSATLVAVTNMNVTITTLGSPVKVFTMPDGSTNPSELGWFRASAAAPVQMRFALFRNGTQITMSQMYLDSAANTSTYSGTPYYEFTDVVSAGTYLYDFRVANTSGVATAAAIAHYMKLGAYEL